eukprot:scaffold24119_cov15-Tisochrysis_lutea.AAC.1
MREREADLELLPHLRLCSSTSLPSSPTSALHGHINGRCRRRVVNLGPAAAPPQVEQHSKERMAFSRGRATLRTRPSPNHPRARRARG